jgi:hypothetical protein
VNRLLLWSLLTVVGCVFGTVAVLHLAKAVDYFNRRAAKQHREELEKILGYFTAAARDTGPVRVVPG